MTLYFTTLNNNTISIYSLIIIHDLTLRMHFHIAKFFDAAILTGTFLSFCILYLKIHFGRPVISTNTKKALHNT